MFETHFDDPLSRRRFLGRAGMLAGGLALPGLLSACGDDDGGTATTAAGGGGGSTSPIEVRSDTIVWADYGGTTREARQRAFFEPFTKDTGIKVVLADATPALVEGMGTGGPAKWDELPISTYDLVRFIDEGTVRPFPDGVAVNDTLPEELQPYGWMTFWYSYVQAWLPDTFPDGGPQDWADWFDVKKFPGKRAFPAASAGADATAELALLADGVSPDDLYPLDLERAYAKLDTVRDHLTFYEAFPQVQTLMAQKAVAIGFGPSGLFNGLTRQGVPNEVQWNQGIFVGNTSMVPLQAPHPDAAAALADHTARNLDGQAEFARLTGYGPGNEAALDRLNDDELAVLANSPDHLEIAVQTDPRALARQSTALTDAFTKWASKG